MAASTLKHDAEQKALKACLIGLLAIIEDDDDKMLVAEAVDDPEEELLVMCMTEKQQARNNKTVGYVEKIVPLYTPDEFHSHFRMKRKTVEKLIRGFHHYQGLDIKPGRPGLSMQKVVLLSLWILANNETLSQVSDRFGVTVSTTHGVFDDFCTTLMNGFLTTFIKWPTIEEGVEIAEAFQQRSGFPNVVGAIDGCHIHIKKPMPHYQPKDYVNRKQTYSIKLIAVVNNRMMFTDIYVGCPGSVPDARAFQNSPLYRKLEDGLLPEHLHILGDSAFPLTQYLLVPFKDNGYLAPNQQTYNMHLNSAMSTVKNAFALLKGKFRRLKSLVDVTETVRVSRITVAGCILHNMCIEENDWFANELDPLSDEEDADYDDQDDGQHNYEFKRNDIADFLFAQ